MSKWQIPAKGGHMEVNDGIYYQNMTNKEVAERLKKNDVLLLPVGSTENHGPSAPYGEDTYLDTRLCEQVALATGCTVAQPIWYGSHPYHHLGMPGTIIIPEETLVDYLCAVFAGFWNTGFRKIIVVNGHGQDYVIPAAIHKFGKKFQVPGIVLYVHFWNCAKEQLDMVQNGGPYQTPFIHADEVEQSWSLALFPELCNQAEAVATKPAPMLPPGHINNSAERGVGPIKWYRTPLAVSAWNASARLKASSVMPPWRMPRKPALASKEPWTTWRNWSMTSSRSTRQACCRRPTRLPSATRQTSKQSSRARQTVAAISTRWLTD